MVLVSCVLVSPGSLPHSARVTHLFVLIESAVTHCCKESPAAKCVCARALAHTLRVEVRACLSVAVHLTKLKMFPRILTEAFY